MLYLYLGNAAERDHPLMKRGTKRCVQLGLSVGVRGARYVDRGSWCMRSGIPIRYVETILHNVSVELGGVLQ